MIKKIFIAILFPIVLWGCADGDVIPNIPLTLDPLVLANPIALATSAPRKRLYVVNSNNRVLWDDASFVVMDISDPINPVPLNVISILNFSGQIILDEENSYVYLPNRESKSEAVTQDQVLRININEASPDFLKVDVFQSGDNPFGAYFESPTLYVAASEQAIRYNINNLNDYTVVDLNVTTNEGQNVNTENTRELSLSPSGANLFVTNRSGNMLILNTEQFTAPTQPGAVELGSEPVDYIVTGTNSTRGITRDANFLYLVDGSPPNLKIMTDNGLAPVEGPPVEISTATLQVASIPIGDNPSEVVLDEENGLLFVSNTGSDDISVIDLVLQQEITRISVSTTPEDEEDDDNNNDNNDEGDQPFGMALLKMDGQNLLYVAHFQTNLISVIDIDNLTVLKTFP